jgi:hypothetical protein
MDDNIISSISEKLGSLTADVASIKGDMTDMKAFVLSQKLRYAKIGGIVVGVSSLISVIGWLFSTFHK